MKRVVRLFLPAAALVLSILIAEPAAAQGKFISRSWTTADGLPHDAVSSVLQTRDGFLWVGTRRGLARFDGVTFQKALLTTDPRSESCITGLCEGPGGELFAGTESDGVFRYARGGWERLGNRLESVASMASSSDGTLWIGTQKGLRQWTGWQFRDFSPEDGLPREPVVGVYAARSGKLWITLRSGVYVMEEGKMSKYHGSQGTPQGTPEFMGVYEDQQNDLWAFGDTYLIKLPQGIRFNYFRSGHLPSIRIWSFHQSRDGRLWIGTSGQGFFQFIDGHFRPVEMKEGRRPGNVRSICEDAEGNLWLGTDGNGLLQLRQDPIQQLGVAEGLPAVPAAHLTHYLSNQVLVTYPDGSLFTGSAHGAFEPYHLVDPSALPSLVHSVCIGRRGAIWVASAGQGISCLFNHREILFSSANGLWDPSVASLCASADGTVWAGTASGALFRFEGNRWDLTATVEDSITSIFAATNGVWFGTAGGAIYRRESSTQGPVARPRTAAMSEISGLVLSPAGILWAATRNSGLVCYNPATRHHWMPVSPFADLRISDLAFDPEGNLWLATTRGVLMARAEDLDERSSSSQVLRLQTACQNAQIPGGVRSILWEDGMLWLLTGAGIATLDIRTVRAQPRPPRVYVESVVVNNKPLMTLPAATSDNYQPPVRTSSRVRSIEFGFTSPCLTLAENVRFRYKLEGFDADWIEGKSPLMRRARYGAIPPGEYTFRVGNWDAYGNRNPAIAAFPFVVPVPVWQRPWALLSYALALAGIVYFCARFVSHHRLSRRLLALERANEMSRERMRISQDMHDEIGSKLAKISYLSESVKTELKDAGRSVPVLDSLARTSRDLLRSLDQMVWAVNPRNDSLEQLAVYLARTAAEYFQDTAITCEFPLPDQLPQVPLSAEVRHNLLLAFEEVLTNIMKHSGATRVRIGLLCGDQRVDISVWDDGRGFDPDNLGGCDRHARVGHGIPGLQRRLQGLGGECKITSFPEQGTSVLLSLPTKSPRVAL